MTAVTLYVATLIFLLGSWVSYSKSVRDSFWYLPLYIALGVGSAVVWVWGTKRMDNEAVYTFSLYWDGLMILSYYIAPLMVMGVRPTAPVCLGAALMILGVLCVRTGG